MGSSHVMDLPGVGGVIVDRFVIESIAGSGGMGTVFRATDRRSGGPVALKLCHGGAGPSLARFTREIRALAALHHPGIVGYVADGHTESGQPFLAMEWLDGEDLAKRLRRQPLTPPESMRLFDRVTRALAAAHDAGIVHRDLKPSNVFLRGGRPDDAVLLDFGIARLGEGTYGATLTATGAVVGTPDYMSPEQARGDRDVGPAADLFSLGSVLFECLAGRPPFAAERLMAVLAKIVFEDAPRLSSAWPDAPPALDALLARLLAKDPSARPASASALAAELASLATLPLTPTPAITSRPALAGPEHQILSVVLAAPSAPDATLIDERIGALHAAFSRHDGRAERLADGSIALAFGQTGRAAATDRAAQAARCALLLKEQHPAARIAIATGRGVLDGGTPGGSALDRAAELLDATPPESGEPPLDPDPPIWIDDVTASLVGASFAIRETGKRRRLMAEIAPLDPSRPLLGKPTPCVGRELDLAALGAVLASVIDEPCARVAVVCAGPGTGKSRLRHELVRRAAAQHPDLIVLLGRADPMGSGSSHGLLGKAVRDLCGALEGAPPDELRRRLLSWASERLPPEDAPRTAAFLGELCGAPFADDDLVDLRRARQDAALMAEQIARAFVAFLRAECRARPILCVLEDLHWADRPTVRMVSAALRDLADLPLLVLALARPEIDEIFPRLWEEHGPVRMTLGALGRRACERLARGVLGPSVPSSVVDRIVDQSGGNALFLEELIRAVDDGKGDALPETVLAMLQARLMRLAPEARRVLRAASIFGETFFRGGVRALIGGDASGDDVDVWLRALVEAELIEESPECRLPNERAHRFRHALMRDAAYSMLGEDDRAAGHRAAARWLEDAGERDPMVLAQHCAAGRDTARAGEHYARAAELAHARGDASAVIERAELAVAQDLPESMRARLLALIAEELGWQADFIRAGAVADEVLRLSPPGGVPWATAIAPRIFDVLLRGDRDAADALVTQMVTVTPEPAARAKVAFGVLAGSFWHYLDGRPGDAARLLDRQRELVDPVAHDDLLAEGWRCLTHAYLDAVGDAGPASALAFARRTWETFHAIHHPRGELLAQVYLGKSHLMLGRLDDAERALRSTIVPGVAFGPVDADRAPCLVDALVALGRAGEAERVADTALATLARRNETETFCEGALRASRAAALLALGDADRAEEDARLACDLSRLATAVWLSARASLASILLARGHAEEARCIAAECADMHAARNYHGPRRALARTVHAEALHALGDRAGAGAAIAVARAELLTRTAQIDIPGLQRTFLQGVALHARILELADTWAGPLRSDSTALAD